MNEPKEKSSPAKIIATLAVCLLVGFVVVIVIPNFVRATYETAANGCINNLRQIDAAKNEWALENGKTNCVVAENDIKPYIKLDSNGNLPKCPAGGIYTIGRIGEDPKCSIGTSAWPNDHVLNETNNWWTDFKKAYSKVFGLHHAQPPSK
jgi:competence protein ComGC